MKLSYSSPLFFCHSEFSEKDIPKSAGFRWNPTARRWETAQAEKALKLVKYADETAQKALVQKEEKKAEAVQQSRATTAEIVVPAPNGLEYLPFQKAGIAYAQSRKSVLIADEMGLGKTVEAIGIINSSPEIKKILVICPASLKINWQREMSKWLVQARKIEIMNGKTPSPDADVYICNYDILSKHEKFLDRTWDLIIADEAHYIKNYKAKRSKAVHDLAKKASKRVFLTGTPIVNRPSELYHIISTLGFYMPFWDYMKRYADAHQTKWGWDMTGASNLNELQEKLRENIMVRRLKKDVLTELPPKRRQVIALPENGCVEQIRKEQKFMSAHEPRVAELKAKRDLAIAKGDESSYKKAVEELQDANRIAFSEIAKLRHETAVAKVPAVIEHLQEMLESVEKVVVFAHHHDVVSAIKTAFPDSSVVLTGETSQPDRQKAIDEFQNNPKTRLFIGSITAAGLGITLTAASTVVFAELDWVPGNISQAEDRCHRIGQANSVLVQHLVIDGSIDSKLAKTIMEKQTIIEKALDTKASEPVDFSDAGSDISEFKEKTERKYTDVEKASIQAQLTKLAAVCDGAITKDHQGFNRYDTIIGKSLALGVQTDKQASLGEKILQKYRKQLV